MLHRRHNSANFRVSSVFALMLLVVGACATDRPETQGEAGGSDNQTLTVAAGLNSSRSQPAAEANVGMGYADANASIFENLVAMRQDFQVEPQLATKWEFVAPSTWRFKLLEDVQFHNGTPFNADAVAYTVNELWAERDANLESDSATVVDEYTVEITTNDPDHRFIENIVHTSRGIQAPGTFAGDGSTEASTPTGTGPFEFVNYEEPTQLEVRRFEGYWGDQPAFERMVFRFIPDDNSRVLALKAGEVDAIYDVPVEELDALNSADGISIAASEPGWYNGLHFNSNSQPPRDILQDERVRRALAHAIDKQAIADGPWRGYAEPTKTVMPEAILGEHIDLVSGIEHDPDRARELLDEAGWSQDGEGSVRAKDGRPLELLFIASREAVPSSLPQLVQAQLADVGVATTIQTPPDLEAYFESVRQGAGDLYLHQGNQNTANPILLGGSFTSVTPGGFAGHGEILGPGEEYDRIIRQAYSSELPIDEVQRLAAEAMHIVVDEYVASVPLVGIRRTWAVTDRVKGFEPHPSQIWAKWHSVSLL